MRRLISILIIITLSSCIAVPKKEMVFSEDCGYLVKKMTLTTEYIGVLDSCQSEDCLALFVIAGAVGATSLVVSGSITIIANVIYWLERKSEC